MSWLAPVTKQRVEGAKMWNGTGAPGTNQGTARRASSAVTAQLGRSTALIKGQIWNAMLLFIPLAIAGQWLGFGPVFVFVCSALSCVPLSFRLSQATESLGNKVGPVAGGLLNASFGNAAELVITIIALDHGLYALVRATLIGSIIGQLLLVLGTSLLLAGLKYRELRFSKPLVQMNFALLFIALVVIGLPTLRSMGASEGADAGAGFLAPALAVMLIVIYAVAVVFSLRRQPIVDDEASGPAWKTRKAVLVLATATIGIVVVSELLVGTVLPFVEATGVSEVFVGLMLIPIFSNVVDHLVAITVALKNKMDLSLVVSVGSAVQVACLVLPIVVLIGFATGQSSLGMMFSPVELLVFAAGLLLMVPVLLDGESNWLEGAELLTCYFVVGAVLWTF